MSLSRQLAEFVAGSTFEALPEEAVHQAKRAVLDTLGVALAGCQQEAPTIVAGQVPRAQGADGATVLGWPFRAPGPEAALLNGVSAHALDYDDVSFSMRGHPSAPLLPSALAGAQRVGASGADFLLGIIVGMEVQAKLGQLMGGRHYALGWHPTSTLGSLGAASACARILGLGPAQAQTALGIAASMAGGVRANFGTMTKPLHVGLAARNGVQAAALAGAGFTASAASLDAEDGFVAVFLAEPPEGPAQVAKLGDPYDIISPGLAQKLYPCCYATHRAVDAALELAPQVDVGDITSIRVNVSRGTLMPLIAERPRTGLQGKFSMSYCVSTALADGMVRMSSFTDQAVLRPQVVRLVDVTEVTEDQEPQSSALTGWADLSVTVSSGTTRKARVEVPKGDPRRPLSWNEVAGKFRDCAERRLGADGTQRAIECIERLDHAADTGALTAALEEKETTQT